MPNYTTRPWREYTAVDGHLGTDERVNELFGFPPDVLDVMWETYRDVLPNTNARKGEKQVYFALAYRFIKLGPTRREMYSVLHTPQTGHVNKTASRSTRPDPHRPRPEREHDQLGKPPRP